MPPEMIGVAALTQEIGPPAELPTSSSQSQEGSPSGQIPCLDENSQPSLGSLPSSYTDSSNNYLSQLLKFDPSLVKALLPSAKAPVDPLGVIATMILRKKHHESIPVKIDHKHWAAFDSKGPFPVGADGESQYCFNFYHYATKFVKLYFVKSKSDLPDVLRRYLAWYKTFRQSPLQFLNLDGAGENTSAEVMAIRKENGYENKMTAPNSSDQNGGVERSFRTLGEVARFFGTQSVVPDRFWPYLWNYAGIILNVRKLKNGFSAFFAWYGFDYPLEGLQPFGCRVYYHQNSGNKLQSMQDRAIPGIYLGPSLEYVNAHLIYSEMSGKVIQRSHVKFDPATFPRLPGSRQGPEYLSRQVQAAANATTVAQAVHPDSGEASSPLTFPTQASTLNAPILANLTPCTIPVPLVGSSIPRFIPKVIPALTVVSSSPLIKDLPSTQMSEEFLPQVFQIAADSDQHVNHERRAARFHHENIRPPGSRTIKVPLRLIEVSGIDTPLFELLPRVVPASCKVPKTLELAKLTKEADAWRAAGYKEFASLHQQGFAKFVSRPPRGVQVLAVRNLLSVKLNGDGTGQAKCRTIANAHGNQIRYSGEDFYSPVAKTTAVYTLIGCAVQNNWPVIHLDYISAFLNAFLRGRKIYIETPAGYLDFLVDKGIITAERAAKHLADHDCMELLKALYGLGQSPLEWNQKVDKSICAMGFVATKSDPCCYLLIINQALMGMIALIVDDVHLTGEPDTLAQMRKIFNEQPMPLEDRGDLRKSLGMIYIRVPEGMYIHQVPYLDEILSEYKSLVTSDLRRVPLDKNVVLTNCLSEDEDPRVDFNARRLLGKLLYLCHSRPDIKFSVGLLSRFTSTPRRSHLKAMSQVLTYLSNNRSMGISFLKYPTMIHPADLHSGNSRQIFAYADADHAGCETTRRSTSGGAIFGFGGILSWSSKLQNCVSLSSTEAEIYALVRCSTECIWFRRLLAEMLLPQEITLIGEDNSAAIALSRNPVLHQTMRHIDATNCWLRDKVKDETLRPVKIHTSANVADIFTKILSPIQFEALRAFLVCKLPDQEKNVETFSTP